MTDHAQTREAYDRVAYEYARVLPRLEAETALDMAMIDTFAVRCADARSGVVVDVGCGTGRVTGYLADRGLEATGIDLSPEMIAVARQAHPKLRFHVGALEDLPIQDGAASGVLAWYSMIHTRPDRLPSIAEEFERVLKPGGWLLTAFQAGAGERVERTHAYGQQVTMTNYRHDPDQVIAVLVDAGFQLHAELHRAAEADERTPQSVLLARRRP